MAASSGGRGPQRHHLHLVLELSEVELPGQTSDVCGGCIWHGGCGDAVLLQQLQRFTAGVLVAIAKVIKDSMGDLRMDLLQDVS